MAQGIALTNPEVPGAEIVNAIRPGRFFTKKQQAFMLTEDTAWLDCKDRIIYYAEAGKDITDFSSTPFGDGKKGVLRFAGRLHDLMSYATPILKPTSDASLKRLLDLHTARQVTDKPHLTVQEIIDCGFTRHRVALGIWEAAKIYERILVSVGYPVWRAKLYRRGLRMFQNMYRWWWASGLLELESDPNWREEHAYYKVNNRKR